MSALSKLIKRNKRAILGTAIGALFSAGTFGASAPLTGALIGMSKDRRKREEEKIEAFKTQQVFKKQVANDALDNLIERIKGPAFSSPASSDSQGAFSPQGTTGPQNRLAELQAKDPQELTPEEAAELNQLLQSQGGF